MVILDASSSSNELAVAAAARCGWCHANIQQKVSSVSSSKGVRVLCCGIHRNVTKPKQQIVILTGLNRRKVSDAHGGDTPSALTLRSAAVVIMLKLAVKSGNALKSSLVWVQRVGESNHALYRPPPRICLKFVGGRSTSHTKRIMATKGRWQHLMCTALSQEKKKTTPK